jgi:hypothetical protein
MSEFPKFFNHVNPTKPNRVANTPADEVNLIARGYKQSETKAAQKVADETAEAAKKAEAEAAAKKAASSNSRNS